jgi:hypothetical protein
MWPVRCALEIGSVQQPCKGTCVRGIAAAGAWRGEAGQGGTQGQPVLREAAQGTKAGNKINSPPGFPDLAIVGHPEGLNHQQ